MEMRKVVKKEEKHIDIKIIDNEKVINKLKYLNEKWFDKDVMNYKKEFQFPIETIPVHEQEDLNALDSYIKYYIMQPPVYKLNFHKQLSYLDFFCLGGSHSRFEHIIGTTIIGSKIINILREIRKKNTGDELLEEWERLAFLTALLIHDCGQPPFSHSMEMLKSHLISKLRITIPSNQKLDKVILSYYFSDADNNLLKMLINPWINDKENVKEIKKNKDNFMKLVKCLFNFKAFKENYPNKCFLYELLNSDFDCDRFDWIGRDGMHLGEIKDAVDIRDKIISMFRNIKFFSITEEGKSYENRLAYSIYDNNFLSRLSALRTTLYNNYYHSVACRIFDTVFPNIIYRFLIKYDLIIHSKGKEAESIREKKNDIIKEILKLPDFEFLNFIDYVENLESYGKSWFISLCLNELFAGHFPSVKYQKNIYTNIKGLEKSFNEIEEAVKEIISPSSSDQDIYNAYLEIFKNKYPIRDNIPIEICLYYLCSFLSEKAPQHIFPIQQFFWESLLKFDKIKKKVQNYVRDIKKRFEGKIGAILTEETKEEMLSYPQVFISIPQYTPDFVEIKELNIGRKEKHKGFEIYLYNPKDNNKTFPLKENIPEQKADYYYSVFLLLPDHLVEFETDIINKFEEFLKDLTWWVIKLEQD